MTPSSLVNAKPSPRIVILGGGITGLTVAYRVLGRNRAERQPFDVFLVERGHGVTNCIASAEQAAQALYEDITQRVGLYA